MTALYIVRETLVVVANPVVVTNHTGRELHTNIVTTTDTLQLNHYPRTDPVLGSHLFEKVRGDLRGIVGGSVFHTNTIPVFHRKRKAGEPPQAVRLTAQDLQTLLSDSLITFSPLDESPIRTPPLDNM